jgi:hypothetical protein
MRKKKRETVLPKPEESLVEIRKLINIVATQTALDRIEKLEWTEKQKAIWFLCSGKLTRKQLAQKSGVHLNTVKAFVEEAMTYGLLEEEKAKGGHPKRVIDYAPSEWKNYVKEKRVVKNPKKTEQDQIKNEATQNEKRETV